MVHFAAAHESGNGTFETCQRALRMSAFWGISEVPFHGRQDRFWTLSGHWMAHQGCALFAFAGLGTAHDQLTPTQRRHGRTAGRSARNLRNR